jgi:DNA repair protein SbcC/Rad50
MRLEHLDIAGFGRLRDLSVEFGPGLTVISGCNESGKSTLGRAIRAALYGLDAGSPGHPVEKSDWYRWQPWSPGRYGLVLRYSLQDGTTFRIATRWDKRPPGVEVREIGAGDITASVRDGRRVAPGKVHLGIEESVFLATAFLDDQSLRLGATDTPEHQAQRLQEALERISDSGGEATTREALALIESARERIGNERRTSYGLGQVITRIRSLENAVADARRKSVAIVGEQERLRGLEERAAAAEVRESKCEVRWLNGKIAAIDVELAEITTLEKRSAELRRADDDTAVSFPVHEEERILAQGAELHAANIAESRTQAVWESVAEELTQIEHRQQEISRGVVALGTTVAIDASVRQEATELGAQLRTERAALARTSDVASEARETALAHEIAKNGFGSITTEEARHLQTLCRRANARNALTFAGTAVVLAGAVAMAVLRSRIHGIWPFAIAGGAAGLFALALVLDRERRRQVKASRHAIAQLYLEADLTRGGITDMNARINRVVALQDEVARQSSVSSARDAELAAMEARIATICEQVLALAQRAQVTLPQGYEDSADSALAALADAAQISDRRTQLDAEMQELNTRRADLERLRVAAAAAASERERIESVLRQHLSRCGISESLPTELAIAAFRQSCRRHREHAAAQAELDAAAKRLAQLGESETLSRRRQDFARELRVRGGDPDQMSIALDTAALDTLDREREYARRDHAAAGAEARELRGRLAVLIENAPPLADLEDDLTTCYAERDRAVAQLGALSMAADNIERTTVSVHRALAPRLAKSVAERMSRLTNGRYQTVEIDAQTFAVSLLGDERPEYVPLGLVSHGTRDQVSLLLRVALAETLGSGEPIPLLLDEPLITADEQRRRRALAFLAELSAEQQVILTVNDLQTVELLHELAPELHVVELDIDRSIKVIQGKQKQIAG